MSRSGGKLAPEVNRALFCKNLAFGVTPEELFDLFGRFGAIRQIRQGIASNTKGTAFVVFEDVMDAKSACDKLNGFNFQNRYLVVLYHQPEKMAKAHANDLAERQDKAVQTRKDSAYCVETAGTVVVAEDEATAPKTRDFAVAALVERDGNTTSKNTDTPIPAATAALVTIKANNENGSSVWRRLKVTAFGKLGGKA
ncbi:hypothetical protein LTR08_000825 [Meristemomyces frigidus]|nr:hypothetical protein LTR08_000825 [Meristemomyces frigidus]